MKILIDINVSKKVYERLKNLGYDVIRAADIFPKGASDEEIVKWMRGHNALIITKDKGFPGAKRKRIILAASCNSEASRESVSKLIILRVFPKGLNDSAELNVFSSFIRGIDPFFKGLRVSDGR